MRSPYLIVLTAALLLIPAFAVSQTTRPATTQPAAGAWRTAESDRLTNHVQLTFSDRFLKAGEAYFSPDDSKIIFQAIEKADQDQSPRQFYHMYVADVARSGTGQITGLENITRISPPESANTCGWFHPTRSDTVIFGSTLEAPGEPDVAGYQRDSGRYRWQFPKEMTIVECDLTEADGTKDSLTTLLADPDAYLAECSLTTDGRHLLYCKYVEAEAPSGGDIYVKDLKSGEVTALVDADGYDGGPFFSPDEKYICYRSDRRGDNHLQLFLGKLEYDRSGRITGLKREIQLTDNQHVNWAPFWHPSGDFLIYATSEQGHRNYEVYAIDANVTDGDHEKTKRRITDADRFDGLPVFNSDGTVMMWTSQRGQSGSSQLWAANFQNNDNDQKMQKSANRKQK